MEGFQTIGRFPARPKLNYYDALENRMVKPSVMLKAHLTCIKIIKQEFIELVKNNKTCVTCRNISLNNNMNWAIYYKI